MYKFRLLIHPGAKYTGKLEKRYYILGLIPFRGWWPIQGLPFISIKGLSQVTQRNGIKRLEIVDYSNRKAGYFT